MNPKTRHHARRPSETFAYRGAEWHRKSLGGTGLMYDGDNVVADLDGSTVSRFYVTPMLDQNVSMTVTSGDQAGTYWYSQDERQSVRTLTDSAATVVGRYDYTAFGEPVPTGATSSTIATLNRYTYTGRELNPYSGNYYFRYRTYGPGTGIFTARDPAGFVDGESLNNAVFAFRISVDPKGTWSITRGGGARATVVPTKAKDTVTSLARIIGLNQDESQSWMKDSAGNGVERDRAFASCVDPSLPSPRGGKACCEFTVPNKLLIIVGQMSDVGTIEYMNWATIPILRHRAGQLSKMAAANGYSVVFIDREQDRNGTKDDVLGDKSDLHGFGFFGHGVVGDGDFVLDTASNISAAEMAQYQYAFVVAKFCSAGLGGWKGLVSPNGYSMVAELWVTLPFVNSLNVQGWSDALGIQAGH